MINRTEYVPVEKWGKDHWSTFAYLETCAVDRNGKVENCRMRCDARLHREFAHHTPFPDAKYPTILKEGIKLDNHDDWSCVEDMIEAGYITATTRVTDKNSMFGNTTATIKFTKLGFEVAAELRKHKANGGTFAKFSYPHTITDKEAHAKVLKLSEHLRD